MPQRSSQSGLKTLRLLLENALEALLCQDETKAAKKSDSNLLARLCSTNIEGG